jgi:ATP-dependent RNA helicase DDX31/DBP7
MFIQVSMKELAADAFRSYVRAYTAYKGDLKTIFQVKGLHLGHVAKSFGLRDSPSLLSKSLNKKRSKELKANATKKRKQKRMKPASMLE